MSNSLFGTDGVRGVANAALTPELAFKLGEAIVKFAGKRIVVGRDTRLSGQMLESALSAGIQGAGGNPHMCGVIPTPGVALLTRELEADGGVVISASHNAPEYNGIKFFSSAGVKFPDALEDEIAAFVLDTTAEKNRPIGSGLGHIVKVKSARERYITHAISCVSGDLSGIRVAVDCAHGASCQTTPEALRQLGCEVVAINTDYHGMDINVDCGSTHLEQIHDCTLSNVAALGIAHDGDADRVLLVDELGNTIDGDEILAVCARDLKERGELVGNEVVATVMSNMGLTKASEAAGYTLSRAKVGDRYVLETMIAHGAILGGEQSGHIIFLKHNTTGDGLVTALQFMDVMARSGLSASQLVARAMKKYPQVLINVRVDDVTGWDTDNDISRIVESQTSALGADGRVLVRASGTEPLIRVMVEASTTDLARDAAQSIAQVVERKFK